jgi:hypothetical protein
MTVLHNYALCIIVFKYTKKMQKLYMCIKEKSYNIQLRNLYLGQDLMLYLSYFIHLFSFSFELIFNLLFPIAKTLPVTPERQHKFSFYQNLITS